MFIIWYRVNIKKLNFDPIDYESIDKMEFWIVEDEEPPCLDYEELEAALYEEGAYPINEGSSHHVQGGWYIRYFVNTLPNLQISIRLLLEIIIRIKFLFIVLLLCWIV